jgi:hypothetical protein
VDLTFALKDACRLVSALVTHTHRVYGSSPALPLTVSPGVITQ